MATRSIRRIRTRLRHNVAKFQSPGGRAPKSSRKEINNNNREEKERKLLPVEFEGERPPLRSRQGGHGARLLSPAAAWVLLPRPELHMPPRAASSTLSEQLSSLLLSLLGGNFRVRTPQTHTHTHTGQPRRGVCMCGEVGGGWICMESTRVLQTTQMISIIRSTRL